MSDPVRSWRWMRDVGGERCSRCADTLAGCICRCGSWNDGDWERAAAYGVTAEMLADAPTCGNYRLDGSCDHTCRHCGEYRYNCDCPPMTADYFDPSAETTQWELVAESLTHAQRVLLYGPPGTGKTWAARNTATDDREVFQVICQEEQPVAEMRGAYMPTGGARFTWQDGPAISAWRKGGRLVIDEIDHADPAIWSLLHAVCDDPSISGFRLPTGEHVSPSPGFQVVATMNGQPDDLPDALADRFAVRVEVTRPAPGAVDSLSEPLRPLARTMAVLPGNQRVGLRAWLAYDSLTKSGLAPDRAASLTLGPNWRGVLESIEVANG